MIIGSTAGGQTDNQVRLKASSRETNIVVTIPKTGDDYVVLEASTNLTTWTAVRTNRLRLTPLQLTIHATERPERFYRVVFFPAPPMCGLTVCEPGQTEESANGICPTNGAPDDPMVRDLAIPTLETPIKTIRLMFHVLAEDNGSNPAASEAMVEQEVLAANNHFRPWRIQFAHQSRTTNSSSFRRIGDSFSELAMKRTLAVTPERQLNIFVTESADGSFSVLPWKSLALAAEGGTVLDTNAFGRIVLTHELGHALGLWHVFHGTSPEENVHQNTPCWECADGRNADTAGDRCSDTLPVPDLRDDTGALGIDPCSGHPWQPYALSNFMSLHWRRSRFTPQQAGRMHAWIEHRLSGWLDLETPAAPHNFRGTPSQFGPVELAWSDNSWNETGFLIERSGDGITYNALMVLPSDMTAFTDLTPLMGANFYRISALNHNSGRNSYFSLAPTVMPAPLAPIFCVDPQLACPPVYPSFPTVTQAVDAVISPTIIVIQAGTYTESLLISNKVLRLQPIGGSVRLQRP